MKSLSKIRRIIVAAICLVMVSLPVVGAEVTTLTLVNASTNNDIQTLTDGATIDLATTGSSLNVRANISGTVTKVNFALSGAMSHTQSEGAAPYALYGDASGNYNSWTPVVGSYTLVVDCDGANAKTVNFTVVNGGAPPPGGSDGDGTVTIGGVLRQWHRVDLKQAAKYSSETANPNPFLDYRMNVTFTAPSGKTYLAPGYFATDGNGGDAGNVWMAHLNPHETGQWNYSVSFRSGTNVAVNLSATAGTAVSPFNGKTGTFTVQASNKTGNDFRAADKGMLVNRGNHYLTYGGSGKPFLFTGPGIPENILGYRGFTNTTVGIGHNFDAHLSDWHSGDPDWNGGAGKKLIGALNYIAEQGGNVIYMMSNTIGGDGKDCFPHPTTTTSKDRYDLLKLKQWDIALAHAQAKGIYLHWVLAETETGNHEYYGGTWSAGSLTVQRKLYFRMLNAVFGHYNGLKWNLCEEGRWVAAERRAQMGYIHAIDPYDHPVTFQVGGAGFGYTAYNDNLGEGDLDACSFQGSPSRTSMYDTIQEWRTKSANAGVKWTCAWDEPQKIENDNTDEVNGYPMGRRDKMWPCLMAGGDGFLWYIQKDGGGHGFDQRIEDFTIMKNAFNWCAHIRTFLGDLPLTEMTSSKSIVNSSTGNDYTLVKPGEIYAIFNDRAGTGMTLNLSGVSGTFTVKWFDPRNGGALQNGSVTTITGGGSRNLGNAPSNTGSDWAVLVQKQNGGNQPPSASITAPANSTQYNDGDPINITATASDSDGTVTKVEFFAGASKIGEDTTAPYSFTWNGAAVGAHSLTAKATDNDGAAGTSSAVSITVNAANQAPVVSFITPTNGTTYTAPATINLVDVSATDADGSIANVKLYLDGSLVRQENVIPYQWNPTKDTVLANLAAGTYQLKAIATDDKGATGEATISITVNDPGNLPPIAVATAAPNPTTVGTTVTLSSSGSSDPDNAPNDPMAYSWTCTDWPVGSSQPAPTNASGDWMQATFVPGMAGNYVWELTVDDGAATDTDTVTVVVGNGAALTMTVTVPTQATEGDGTVIGSVQLNRTLNPGESVTVNLSSSDTTEATVQASVTMGPGESSATFNINVQDDTIDDTHKDVTITATASGMSDATDVIQIRDNDGNDDDDHEVGGGGGGGGGCTLSHGPNTDLLPLMLAGLLLIGLRCGFLRKRTV